ncbi:hypothetical protein V7S43_005678 [Phytophthora oleae]|uniref:RxLR effector protein n=1 Tax=Phytophthora oleae TaxID=2107226 RepID=A0ABD3FSM7_9STRA
MRVCFVLLLAVTTLLAGTNSVSGSSIKLRASQNLVQSIDAGRELRGEVKTDAVDPEDEERALNLNFGWIKQLSAKMKSDPLKSLVKSQLKYVYSQRIADKLMASKIDPDDLVRMFRLDLSKNRANIKGVKTRKWDFFLKFRVSYIEKNLQWQSAFKKL